ncbi:MAG: glycosyltransferase, partial [Actinobacteria bacterium]|nr:glycosyltransferase [Actinomycetota bacterium]
IEDGLKTGTRAASETQHHPMQDEALEKPSVTVAVCTRDRPDSLEACLASLERLEGNVAEVIVVDNAPSSDATRHLVASGGPEFRYVRENRPGLDWARNRAIVEARGDIIAFTDDDCIVDPGWTHALALAFSESPHVSAVTGLVVPYELETEAQILFEAYGGFGRGFRRRWHHVSPTGRAHIGSGNFGTGANMAFRRSTLERLGGFDPALDVGTVTNGGGDIEMFFRVLQEGHTLVYDPNAIVRHRHRRDYANLHRQLTDHGIGFSSYVTRSVLAYPAQLRNFMWFTRWWLWRWILRRIGRSVMSPASFPIELVLAELKGGVKGLTRYRRSRRRADQIRTRATETGSQSETP